MEDVQRRIAEQVRELHLDERFAVGREALGRNLAFGREKASTVFGKIYADMEAFREAQRRKNEENSRAAAKGEDEPLSPSGSFGGVDLGKAQQTVSSVGARAGAYVSSWAAWAGEKRKTGGGGWGWGRGRGKGEGLLSGEAGRGSREVERREDALAGDVALYEVRSEDEAGPGEGYVAVERASGEGLGRRSGSGETFRSEEGRRGEPVAPAKPGAEKGAGEQGS